MMTHNCQDLVVLFNELFEVSEKTVLIGNAEEPLYLPADDVSDLNRIYFTRDYFASALHEVAHWCLAGEKRRLQVDYGYWYYPEGRNEEQQKLFEQAEVKPQAIERLFAEAAGSRFLVSQDNLMTGYGKAQDFEKSVTDQAEKYMTHGLPPRAERFHRRLLDFYRSGD